MMDHTAVSSEKPHSVALLTKLNAQAPVRHVQQGIPIDRYHRSAALLLRQVEQYRASHDSATYYVFLLRYVQLVLQTIPEHSRFAGGKSAPYRRLREEARRLMPELERVKRELEGIRVPVEDRAIRKMGASGPSDNGTRATRLQSGHVPGLNWNDDVVQASIDHVNGSEPPPRPSDAIKAIVGSISQTADAGLSTSGRHVVMATPSKTLSSHPLTSQMSTMYPNPRIGMRLGPQEVEVTSLVPASSCLATQPGSHYSHKSLPGDHRHDGASTCCTAAPLDKAAHLADKVTQTIRNVHISAALMNEFLRYASSNTRSSIETCGILAGRLLDTDGTGQLTSFVISHLIVPKQEGTSDTVQALAEEEIYEAQDSRSLYPLGWIHTHPTQTCFLSSIDVHTQCGYQTMLDEAIAIVMAPTDAESPVGIFRLSTPGGLKLIQKCSERGFHPHGPTETGQPLYELCNHVYLDPRVDFEVLDLR